MTEEELLRAMAWLLTDARGWDDPADYEPEAEKAIAILREHELLPER